MLSGAIFNQFKDSFALAIDTLGVPGEFHQTKPPSTVTPLTAVGFRTPGQKDESIINTIGVGGRIITVKAADLTVAPMKLDVVIVHGEKYTVEAVHVVDLNGTILGWKLLCKGR